MLRPDGCFFLGNAYTKLRAVKSCLEPELNWGCHWSCSELPQCSCLLQSLLTVSPKWPFSSLALIALALYCTPTLFSSTEIWINIYLQEFSMVWKCLLPFFSVAGWNIYISIAVSFWMETSMDVHSHENYSPKLCVASIASLHKTFPNIIFKF